MGRGKALIDAISDRLCEEFKLNAPLRPEQLTARPQPLPQRFRIHL